MSETDLFPDIGWDYPIEVPSLDGVLRQRAHDGTPFNRIVRPDLRVFELVRRDATTAQRQQVEAFYRRLQGQFFRYDHPVWALGSWNILGLDAEEEMSGTGQFLNYEYVSGDIDFPLEQFGLKVGDILSIGADLKTSAAGGETVKFVLFFLDSSKTQLSNVATTTESGTSYVRHNKENIVIPANTAFLRCFGEHEGGAAETAFIRRGKLNRGATAEAFEPPFTNQEVFPRSFPVVFDGPHGFALASNESWPIQVRLVEAAGRALLGIHYPDPNDGQTSFFIEEDDPQRAAVISGTWTERLQANVHAGRDVMNANTNTTDTFQFTYAGYGFRVWAGKQNNQGIFEVLLDDVSLGTVDQYASPTEGVAAIFTKLDVPLGIHRVKIRATDTKNGSSSGATISADAIEVML